MNTDGLDSIMEKAAQITTNIQKGDLGKNMSGGAKKLGRPPKKSSKKGSKKGSKKTSKKTKGGSKKSSKKSSKKTGKKSSKKTK